jgi:2-desacetyl-2-hydroxyethyl bacteriochlorophyllide A dehydrogenase
MSQTHTVSARAAWIVAPHTVELREEAVPPPGPGEVRVAALASAISHGTELLVYAGLVDAALPLDLPTLAGSFALPIKYGYASVGRVLDVGAGVEQLRPGALVFALHPHQGVFNAPASLVTALPEGLPPERGLLFANAETALNIAHDAAPRLGETILVFGQGIVGLLAAQALRLAGAARVIAVEPDARRRALALALGADAALEPGPALAAQIRALNDGRLADLALEASGAPPALQQAIDSVQDEGTVVVASWYGRKPVSLDLGARFHRGRIRLRSSQVGRLAPETWPRWDHARRAAAVAALLPRLRLDGLDTLRLPLARIGEAYALAAAGAATLVTIDYAEERHV